MKCQPVRKLLSTYIFDIIIKLKILFLRSFCLIQYLSEGVRLRFKKKILFFFLSEDLSTLTNSVDPDEMSHCAALHCL